MALTDENGSTGMVMPVAPMGGYGNGNGSGFFGGDWAWIILLLLIGGTYADGNGGMGGMSNGGSYARGRTNARRDSMGRYSGERGYSRNAFADELRELMDQAPDERTRQKIQRMAEELENA